MLTSELDHLIKMINQIADNIAIGDEELIIAAKVTKHLQLFWAPPMKKKIINYAANDGAQLNAVAKLAVSQL
jgi:formate dehydrogenase subunit delta|tara:strand:- start:5341 stop:5556 length:216 start_codon:yes stop_codon:yes gene_type:complete